MADIKVRDLANTSSVNVTNKLMILTNDTNNIVNNISISDFNSANVSTDAGNSLKIGTDDKLFAEFYEYLNGTGIDISDAQTLKTKTEVTCSNPNLTVTSSYTGTQPSEGTITYNFKSQTVETGVSLSAVNAITPCEYCIISGKLFHVDTSTKELTQIGSSKGWTAVSGFSYIGNTTYAYGIKDGELYSLQGTATNKIGNSNKWTYLAGFSIETGTPANDYVCWAICDSHWYIIIGESASQANSTYNFTAIGDSYGVAGINRSGGVNYGVPAIADGHLWDTYRQSGLTTIYTTGQDAITGNWTDVCGYFTDSDYAYALCSGQLCVINASGVSKVGNDSTWTAICGKSSSSDYAYGINNGALYSLVGSTVTLIDNTETWSAISGFSNTTQHYAYGIRNGKLFKISANNIIQIGNETTWTEIYAHSAPNMGLCAFGISDNKFKLIDNETVTDLSQYMEYEPQWLNIDSYPYVVVDLSTYDLSVSGSVDDGDFITLKYITTVDVLQKVISTSSPIPTKTSQLTNDSGFIDSSALAPYQLITQNMTSLSASGTIALTDNSINKIDATGTITFTLPNITDLTKFHQVLVQLNMASAQTINVGTTYYFNATAPDLSTAGTYNLYWEYDNVAGHWVVGSMVKGA